MGEEDASVLRGGGGGDYCIAAQPLSPSQSQMAGNGNGKAGSAGKSKFGDKGEI